MPKPTVGCSANGRRRRSIVLPKISMRNVAVPITDRSVIKEDCKAAITAVDVLKELVLEGIISL